MNCKVVFRWPALAASLFALAVSSGCEDKPVQPMQPAALDWPTDLPAAQTQAKTSHKLVLVDFSGSDWCVDCARLAKNVFYSPDFKAYAQANLELVDIDLPQKKDLPPAQEKANKEIVRKYNVSGFPTEVVLDAEGKQLATIDDAANDTPAQFIARLEKLKAQAK